MKTEEEIRQKLNDYLLRDTLDDWGSPTSQVIGILEWILDISVAREEE